MFKGFRRETVQFLLDLSQNNNKGWFEENRAIYEKYVLSLSKDFVVSMGEALSKKVPGLSYSPKVNHSLFKIHRDSRFNRSGNPYKTQIGIIFWKGPFSRRVLNPCFYFHLEPAYFMLATGLWDAQPVFLKAYRKALVNEEKSKNFLKIVDNIEKQGINLICRDKLKKPIKNLKEGTKLGFFSTFKGIVAEERDVTGLNEVVFSSELVSYCLSFYEKTLPLFDWLLSIVNEIDFK